MNSDIFEQIMIFFSFHMLMSVYQVNVSADRLELICGAGGDFRLISN